MKTRVLIASILTLSLAVFAYGQPPKTECYLKDGNVWIKLTSVQQKKFQGPFGSIKPIHVASTRSLTLTKRQNKAVYDLLGFKRRSGTFTLNVKQDQIQQGFLVVSEASLITRIQYLRDKE